MHRNISLLFNVLLLQCPAQMPVRASAGADIILTHSGKFHIQEFQEFF
jgi:hypothetical protein